MSEAAAPEPTAIGELTSTPFAHVLVYIHSHELTGTLVVWPVQADAPRVSQPPGARREDRILVVRGTIVAARLAQPASSIELGLLPLFMRVDAPYAFYDVNVVGDAPEVQRGRVHPISLVTASLRGGARDDIVEAVLAHLGHTRIRMQPGVDLQRFGFDVREQVFVDVVRAGPATVEELVATSGLKPVTAKRLLYLLTITKAVQPYQSSGEENAAAITREGAQSYDRSKPLMMTTSAVPGAPPPASSLPPRASVRPTPSSPILSPARSDSPPPTASGNPPRRSPTPSPLPIRNTLPPGNRKSLSPPNRHQSKPPSTLDPDLNALWAEIVYRSRVIENMNYFDMLELPKDAKATRVREQYFELAKKWHPDRLPAELAPLLPEVQTIFRHLTEAHDTLTDETKRDRYLMVLAEGGGTPAAQKKMSAIIEAAMEYQKAEVLVRRHDYEGALKLVENALRGNADEADYHAMHAWLKFQKDPEPSPTSAQAMLVSLDRALALNADNDKAHYYKAMLLKRVGREDKAIKHFQRAAELNPRNVDAVREVRLANLRKGGKRPSASKMRAVKQDQGLLSKLFDPKKPTR